MESGQRTSVNRSQYSGGPIDPYALARIPELILRQIPHDRTDGLATALTIDLSPPSWERFTATVQSGFCGTVYRPTRTYRLPSHNSKMVLSIVKKGPPAPAYLYCSTN